METIYTVIGSLENPLDPQSMYIFGYLKYLFFKDQYEKYNQLAGMLFMVGCLKNQAISYAKARFQKSV